MALAPSQWVLGTVPSLADWQAAFAATPVGGTFGTTAGTYMEGNDPRAEGKSRVVTGSATPTIADVPGLVVFTSSSAVTCTATNIGTWKSYAILQNGTGQVTVIAASGITLISDKATPSFVTARRGAVLTILSDGANNVFVMGNTG